MADKYDNETFALGPCCRCRRPARSEGAIIMLDLEAPLPGHGWGCVQCDVPADGACVVLCKQCADDYRLGEDILAYCEDARRGFPALDGRCSIRELTNPFGHDLSKHPEMEEG